MKIAEELSTILEDSKPIRSANACKSYMDVNVILTFDGNAECKGSQEMFDFKILVSKNDVDPVLFFHKKFFKRIVQKCKNLERDVGSLIKISTCSDWRLYEKVTKSESLCTLGHSCKWYFGDGRVDLDPWERALMQELGFGKNADMSWVNDFEGL
jgi:hypothetical protein